jgi:protein-tyrosine phosphatase
MGTERQRRLDLQGAVNFRDLGGYAIDRGRRTRWGVLWRSDSLSDLTDTDLLRVAELGLHALIDFRLPLERARRPNRLPPGGPLTTVELGFIPDGTLDLLRRVFQGTADQAAIEQAVLRHYRAFPHAHTREYGAMFDHIERAAGKPVLIHCTSGKDRTGFGAALILLALGASRETILADYALTNLYRRDVGFLFSPGTPPEVVRMLTAAPPKYLAAALDVIEATHGSAEAYLEAAYGLGPARRARLREALTEEDEGLRPSTPLGP